MSEEELRKEAVRRRNGGESAEEVAKVLGRTSRWVRKWAARYEEEAGNEKWAKGRSRVAHSSPGRTPAEMARLIVEARRRLSGSKTSIALVDQPAFSCTGLLPRCAAGWSR